MNHNELNDSLADATARLRKGDAEGCVAVAQDILAKAPDHRDALYLLAVGLRYAGRLSDAEQACNALIDIAPDYGRAWQELGHVLVAQGRVEAAAWPYSRAVQLNPALEAGWTALEAIHRSAGQADAARNAAAQRAWLAGLPPELAAVENFIAEKALGKAEQICRAFLKVNPHHVEAMRQLAEIGMAMNILDDAEILLAAARKLAPDNARVHSAYVTILNRRQKYADAVTEAQALLASDPANIANLVLLGNGRIGAGDFDGAIAAYDGVLAAWPQADNVHLSRGHALKTIGRLDQAVEAYRAAYGARPDFGDAYWSLANLKTYRFTDDEVDAMHHWQAAPRVTETDRIHLHFALGKALEDRRDYAAAFAQYKAGNDLKLRRSGYSAQGFDVEVERMIAATPAGLFIGAQGGWEAADPIFVVGLPRSGSTLIEQILASHSQIDGTAELPNILAQVHALSSRDLRDQERYYPFNLPAIDGDAFSAMGRKYIEETRGQRGSKPFFVDKMPNNFRHIGLIARMLPNARIIDARRDPMACCFSGFKQLFAEGQEFSYGLDEIGHYYLGYRRLMEHWHSVLPSRILTVHHEDVLEDLEGQVRRLLDFLGLPFEEGCVRFHENRRAVRTASSEQVRRPIDRSMADQWRNFEPFLAPLLALLEPAGVTSDDSRA